MGDEVRFLPANKHESFLQVVSISLGVHGQQCQKYPKKQVYNILAIFRENVKNEVNILPTDKCQRLLQIATIILGVNDQAYPNYPK